MDSESLKLQRSALSNCCLLSLIVSMAQAQNHIFNESSFLEMTESVTQMTDVRKKGPTEHRESYIIFIILYAGLSRRICNNAPFCDKVQQNPN